MPSEWAVEKAREWLMTQCAGRPDVYEPLLNPLAALLEEVAQGHDEYAHRAAMLVAVHGALVDAGFRMGEVGHCELDLVRRLTRERDEAHEALRVLTSAADEVLRGWDAKRQLDSGFTGMGHNILTENVGKYSSIYCWEQVRKAVEKARAALRGGEPSRGETAYETFSRLAREGE